jgi:hypothetical protein
VGASIEFVKTWKILMWKDEKMMMKRIMQAIKDR